MTQTSRRIGTLLFTVVIFGAVGLAWLQKQAIYDWARLRDYNPPADIARLADETTMNDSGRHLFYVYHPQLNDRASFGQNCTNIDEQTIVLGCYISSSGIYLFDVDDPRLEGVEQVTAAHEMLHAAYDRLSLEERSKVDTLTQQTLASLTNERIKTTMENYRRRDPGVVPNELHSILATEVRELPLELETYYKKYFDNRAQVVAFSERYEGVLTAQRNRASTLETEITGLRAEIEQLEHNLAEQREQLQHDRPEIDTQAEVVAYNARVNSYNAHIRELNTLISRHNRLVEEYKTNAVEQQELFKALDSRPTL